MKNLAPRISGRVRRLTHRYSKSLRQRATNVGAPAPAKIIAFVAGCQRSGTSMTYRIFDRDPSAQVFDEVSVLSNRDRVEGLRFNDLDNVRNHFRSSPARLIVAKPLVESQRLATLLDAFEGSKAIWMYRNYSDVISSNLKRFGADNGHNDLQPIIDGDKANWRAEGLEHEVVEQIRAFDRSKLSRNDAAALFWYARNSLLFKDGLVDDERVQVCRYEDLVTRPEEVIQGFYHFLNYPYPNEHSLAQGISTSSLGKGGDITLSPDVEELCESMYQRLLALAAEKHV